MERNEARLGWAAQQEPDVLLIELLSLKEHEGLKVRQIGFHGAVPAGNPEARGPSVGRRWNFL